MILKSPLQNYYYNQVMKKRYFYSLTEDFANHFSNYQSRQQNDRFHFRKKIEEKTSDDAKDIFKNSLEEAQKELSINQDDMILFCFLAIKHEGLGNAFQGPKQQKIETDFKELFGDNW